VRIRHLDLLNTPEIELWPAWTLRARSAQQARRIAAADWVLRRKRDGRFLACVQAGQLFPLQQGSARESGLDAALRALHRYRSHSTPRALPQGLALALELGIPPDYAQRTGLPPVTEPDRLTYAGRDRYQRPLWLLSPAARAWTRMRAQAAAHGVAMDAISGFRSEHYQHGIFVRKLARGLRLDEILAVNAAPGFSEHHSGRAIDIGTTGVPAAEACFEHTDAYAWLQAHASAYGFRMSYPRENPHGVVFEPWHWCWWPAPAGV